MKKNKVFLAATVILLTCICDPGYSDIKTSDGQGRDRLLNTGWRFIRDSIPGAENKEFDDSKWLIVDLPHDFSIMNLPGEDGPDQVGPFSKKYKGYGNSTGQTIGGTGWYRKTFILDKSDAGKTVILSFDGVYMESEIWVNGKKAGIHKNGYTPFWIDITSLLNKAGNANVIAVRVDNTGRNTRWYSGSGIYRNVHLILTQPVHIGMWGIRIKTPVISQNSATVNVEVTAVNKMEKDAATKVTVRIKDRNGSLRGSASENVIIPARSSIVIEKSVEIQNPLLWSVDSPDLYTAGVTLETDSKLKDNYSQSFGIRSVEFSAEKGFLLNGKPVELRGGCLHHDNGMLGSAAFDRAEERRVEILKANGFNAIRCAHNPPSSAFLDACDRQGILVIDEFTDMWEAYKNPQDYSRFFREWWNKDLTDMIMRDRNHPGIIMWSIGNEVIGSSDTTGLRIGRQLTERIKALDDTRAVTEAVSEFFIPGGWANTVPVFQIVDVCGYQYAWEKYEPDHQMHPERIMYASESFPLDAYDSWKAAERLTYVIGDFVWTSMDYLGEVSLANSSYVAEGKQSNFNIPGDFKLPSGINVFDLMARGPSNWPNFVSWCGDIDITGEKKSQTLYRSVLWDKSKLEITVHEPVPDGFAENISRWGWPREWPFWSWKGSEGKPLQVRVFTKASAVQLELNGEVIDEKELYPDDKYIAVFEVPYQPGELKAVALINDNVIATKSLKTPGEPFSVRLQAERNIIKADRNDLSYIKIEIIDSEGNLVPDNPVPIRLTITGNGELAGSGNADPKDMLSFNRPVIKTFNGKAMAIIRPFTSGGEIKIRAESEGLKSGEAVIQVKR